MGVDGRVVKRSRMNAWAKGNAAPCGSSHSALNQSPVPASRMSLPLSALSPLLLSEFVYSTCVDDTVLPFMSVTRADGDTPSWGQAMKGNEKHKWIDGKNAELDNLDRYGTVESKIPWDAVPQCESIYDTMYVCNRKRDRAK